MLSKVLKRKFFRSPKFEIPEGCGIVTATDSNFFSMFQLLYYSLALSHEFKMTLFDLGLKSDEKRWCEEQELTIEDVPNIIIPTDVDHWQTWNKPLYIKNSPYEKTLWLDVDLVVNQDISSLFDNEEFVAFECELGWNKNTYEMHEILRSNSKPHQTGPPNLNAGVLLFTRSSHDTSILERWIKTIRAVRINDHLRNFTPWWDQGALQWVLETGNQIGLIRRDFSWNHNKLKTQWENITGVVDFMQSLPQNGRIIHYAGPDKTKKMTWPRKLDVNIDSTPAKTSEICILGDFSDTVSEDYVGYIPDPAAWDDCSTIRLNDFHLLSPYLQEDRVFGGRLVTLKDQSMVRLEALANMLSVNVRDVRSRPTVDEHFICHKSVFQHLIAFKEKVAETDKSLADLAVPVYFAARQDITIHVAPTHIITFDGDFYRLRDLEDFEEATARTLGQIQKLVSGSGYKALVTEKEEH